MAKDRSKEYKAKREKSAREKKELVRLRKRRDDFVQKHLAAGTAAGDGYEKEVKKRQDAVDEYYAGTIAGKDVAQKKARMQAAEAESVDLEAQIQELRDTSDRLSRKTKRKI